MTLHWLKIPSGTPYKYYTKELAERCVNYAESILLEEVGKYLRDPLAYEDRSHRNHPEPVFWAAERPVTIFYEGVTYTDRTFILKPRPNKP